MKLVLRSDVAQVGKKGEIVDVSDGYGRNFLIPKGLAFVATSGVEAQAEAMRRNRAVRDANDRAGAQAIASKIVGQVVTIAARAGVDGRLFGSVTTSEVAEALAALTGVEVDRRHMHLSEPIKSLGTHQVPAKLHADVEFEITVEVVAS